MRKLLLVLIIFSLFVVAVHSANKAEGTVEGAIKKTGRKITMVIHEEEVKGGVVVFYKDASVINSGFVKKNIWGWHWVWGGGHSGYSHQYFPSADGTPFPMLFGEIRDSEVKIVRIIDPAKKTEKDSRIVSNDGTRLWFAFLDKSEGPRFKILWLSGQGKILNSEEIETDSDSSKQLDTGDELDTGDGSHVWEKCAPPVSGWSCWPLRQRAEASPEESLGLASSRPAGK